jgi:NAD-dependent dihydropyrimidine dehydrogenase PreA subunit
MIRDIISIDKDKCNGCGICASACHEGALAIVDGKAQLISESYCDGLGACLPECPTGAISVEKREAAEFSLPEDPPEAAPLVSAPDVRLVSSQPVTLPCGCPGSHSRSLKSSVLPTVKHVAAAPIRIPTALPVSDESDSELIQWPCQLKLVPVNAPYFDNARILIAADCAAYARASFHREFMRGRVTLIGCPKLDSGSYVDKLTEIFRTNPIKSIMVVRMEVPCCGGIEAAVRQALMACGKMIPWQVVTLSTDGRILAD